MGSKLLLLLHSPGQKKMALFLEVLSRWLMQGMAPAQAALGLAELYRRSPEAKVAHSLLTALQSGLPLSAGLGQWLNANDRHRLAALERREDMPAQMRHLSQQMLQRTGLFGALLGKLAYGVMLVVVTAAILILVVAEQVLPVLQSTGLLENPTLEFLILSTVSRHLSAWWWLWPVILASLIAAIGLAARLWVGRSREICDHLPLLRWYRRHVGAQLLQVLALLVHTGDTWMIAAQRLTPTASPYYRALLGSFQRLLAEGRSPVAALEMAGWLTVGSRLQLRAVANHPDLSEKAETIAREQSRQSEYGLMFAARIGQILLFLLAGSGLLLILGTGRALGDPGSLAL